MFDPDFEDAMNAYWRAMLAAREAQEKALRKMLDQIAEAPACRIYHNGTSFMAHIHPAWQAGVQEGLVMAAATWDELPADVRDLVRTHSETPEYVLFCIPRDDVDCE